MSRAHLPTELGGRVCGSRYHNHIRSRAIGTRVYAIQYPTQREYAGAGRLQERSSGPTVNGVTHLCTNPFQNLPQRWGI